MALATAALRNLHCKLPLWHLIFLNYTAKYEALEKNAVSELKMQQLQYSRLSRKAPL
jgi:hypothetical protein